MKKLFTFALLCLTLSACAQVTSVSFPLNTLFGGAAYNRQLTLTAANTLISDGQNLWAGTYTLVPASTTNPVVGLYPNTYLLTVPGVVKPVRFTVPASTNVLDVTTLLVSGPLFYFGTNGMANLIAGTNFVFVTNSDGSITLNTQLPGYYITNYNASAVTLSNNLTVNNTLLVSGNLTATNGTAQTASETVYGLTGFDFIGGFQALNTTTRQLRDSSANLVATWTNGFNLVEPSNLGAGTNLSGPNIVGIINPTNLPSFVTNGASPALNLVNATNYSVSTATGTLPIASLPGSVVTTSNTPTQMGIQPVRPYFGFVAAGNDNMPQALYSGNKVENDWQPFIALTPITNMQAYFANFYGNTETAPGGVATVSAAVSYSNVITQLQFAGGQYTNIPNGQMAASLVTTIPLIPVGGVGYFRTFYTNGAGVILNQNGTGPLEYSGFGATGTDQSTNISIPGSIGAGNYSYGPLAILGNTTKASVLILGDSRDWGVGDGPEEGPTTIPPFTRGIARLFVPYYPFCNLSCPGDIWTSYTGPTNRMFFTNFATVIWTDLGINEYSGGSPSLLVNHATNFYRLFSMPVCVETISPRSTSTDGFFTTANQTPAASDNYRTNFNSMLRAHTMPNVSHFLDVARLTESDSVAGQNSGIWNVWATTNFDGAGSQSLTNMTADGTHGDYFGVLANGVGDPLKQEVPYIPTGLFPTVLTASGTFSGNGIGLTNLNSLIVTNSTSSLLANGGFVTMPAAGYVSVTSIVTNSQIVWLTNATSHQVIPYGNLTGVWTNYDSVGMWVNKNDSVGVTNISGSGGSFLYGSFLQVYH